MGWLKQETAYERKIRELEEEADRIRKNMQSIMKNVDRGSVPSRSSTSAYVRNIPPATPAERRTHVPPTDPETDLYENDRADENDTEEYDDSESPSTVIHENQVPAYGPARLRHNQAPKPEKLANYLASGSFGKRGSLTRERKIQRNKAIFMLVLALLAVFSLFISIK